ncbi:hypothetical protein [Pelagibacterium sp.]|uniref:hypothetical protein n=1 Tax=Pelagibacterium sp. TaxID=1967288 RepID=UPI003A92583D
MPAKPFPATSDGFTDQHAAMLAAIKTGEWEALGVACEADIRASRDLLFDILKTEEQEAPQTES